MTHKKVLKQGSMSTATLAKSGIDDIYEIKARDPGIRILQSEHPLFSLHKKNYQVWKRLEITLSDEMRIVSLAKLEICIS